VNWTYWARLPAWTLDETAALFLALDPDTASNETSVEHKNLRRILYRAKATGEMDELIQPEEAVEWAESNALDVPEALLTALNISPPITNWRDLAIKYQKRIHKLKIASNKREEPVEAADLRSLKNLYRILYAIAADRFGFDPDKNNSAAANITTKVALFGFRVSEQTIRQHLKAAAEAIGDEVDRAEGRRLPDAAGRR